MPVPYLRTATALVLITDLLFLLFTFDRNTSFNLLLDSLVSNSPFLTPNSIPISELMLESFRFEDEDGYEYEI